MGAEGGKEEEGMNTRRGKKGERERLFIEKKRALKQQNPKNKLGTEITTKKKNCNDVRLSYLQDKKKKDP